MKNIFLIYAEHNKKSNEKLVYLLADLPEELIRKEIKSFYKSVLDALIRMIFTDIRWFKRAERYLNFNCFKKSIILKNDMKEIKNCIEEDYRNVFIIIKDLDDLFVDFSKELRNKDLKKKFRYKNQKGEEVRKTYWHVVLHFFNHDTHVRGQISAMLDILKIETSIVNKAYYIR